MIVFSNRLVRFCPYTTLKKQASASENPLVQRIRGWKTLFICLALAVVLMMPIVFSFFSEPQMKLVTLSDLEVRVVTDKMEYRVNETIRAALYVYNHNHYPVRFEPIREIYVSGNSIEELEKILAICSVDYAAQYQYMVMEANSSQVLYKQEFVPRILGGFMINVLGASTTVNVIDYPGA